MDANELGRLFQRFRERHDLAALSLVFDACAERLLGVARHLARDEESAEDLVQATFLVAIAQAERFERGIPFATTPTRRCASSLRDEPGLASPTGWWCASS